MIAVTEREYFKALETSVGAGVTGGGIYDGMLARCALKAGAETIYTWNVKHFKRLGAEVAGRVATP